MIEGNENNFNTITSWKKRWKYDLNITNKFITRENINKIINEFKPPNDIGLLSIDIDGNDYWILKELDLKKINPLILIIEYNSLFGNKYKITVPYDNNFQRKKKSFSNLYFGCSIQALIDQCKNKGYHFIGTNKNGCNAFFVNELFFSMIKNKITEKKIFLSKFRESRDKQNKLSFLKKNEQLNIVKDLEVFDISENRVKKIFEYPDILNT